MLKILQRSKILLEPFFATSAPASLKKSTHLPKKPYEILLTSSVDLNPKLPNPSLFRTLRSKFITQLMVSNRALKHEGVFQAHIECMHTLVSRLELSIEGVTILADFIYRSMQGLINQEEDVVQAAIKNSLAPLMKPTLMVKFVRVCYDIDGFYNEYFRMMMASFIINAIDHSKANFIKRKEAKTELMALKKAVLQGQPRSVSQDNKQPLILTEKTIGKYVQSQEALINKSFPYLTDKDLLYGMQFVLNFGYFSQSFVKIGVEKLLKLVDKDSDDLSFLIIQIKVLVALDKYKEHRMIQSSVPQLFGTLYPKSVKKYLSLLQNSKRFFEALQDEEGCIQTRLVTQFLTKEHKTQAKQIYMKMFKTIFNCIQNGSLLFDVSKLRGIFEIVLIMFTHQDTKDVYELLELTEKAMVRYPISRLLNLQIHCSVAEKYGFKSDVFANHYLEHLLEKKSKIDRNKGMVHLVHQFSKELHLADKLLVYLSIRKNQFQDTINKVHDLLYELVKSNIWICFSNSGKLTVDFIRDSSYTSSYYFLRSSLINLTSNHIVCKDINYMATHTQLKSINKNQIELMEKVLVRNNKFSLKRSHLSSWKHNQHARLATILKLINHHVKYLTNNFLHKEKQVFIEEFMDKVFMSKDFYQILKKNFNYPDVLDTLLSLSYKIDKFKYPVFFRDLHSVSRFYQLACQKAAKEPEELYNIYYQEGLHSIELNRVMIPSIENFYSVLNSSNYLSQGLVYQALRRYYLSKQNLKMQIQTFNKYQPNESVKVETNVLEYPYLADLKISLKEEVIVLLFNFDPTNQKEFLNENQLKMQQRSASYWQKDGFKVRYIRSEKDIEDFIENTIKKTNQS